MISVLPSRTHNPRMIFFDAAGTLIRVNGSVGAIYSTIAREVGIEISSAELEEAFARSIVAQPPMAFPRGLHLAALQRAEQAWWRSLVRDVFAETANSPHFESLFERLFEHFRDPRAWLIFPDVAPTLRNIRARGLRLAVLSNFDSRLDHIMAGLELSHYFDAIHLSTRIGYAKPDPRIFASVLTYHGIRPDEAWHVGDSLRDDVEGALNSGVLPIWLDRKGTNINNERLIRIQTLDELPDLLIKE